MKKLTSSKVIALTLTLLLILTNSVNVFAVSEPEKAVDEEVKKEVYLTFDDGPIPGITEKLLDVLGEHKVKATFFVVGKEIKGREMILKKIYEEGHSIGLHTYSHNFSVIYKSDDNFVQELDKTAYMIRKILGYKATSVRFPGGSDRVLSQELLQKLHDKDYKVYDWNVNLEDGDKPKQSPEIILKKAKQVKGNKNRRFILAHCNVNNGNTVKALPEIIKYYKEEGFEFKTIEKDTEEYYYKLKNR